MDSSHKYEFSKVRSILNLPYTVTTIAIFGKVIPSSRTENSHASIIRFGAPFGAPQSRTNSQKLALLSSYIANWVASWLLGILTYVYSLSWSDKYPCSDEQLWGSIGASLSRSNPQKSRFIANFTHEIESINLKTKCHKLKIIVTFVTIYRMPHVAKIIFFLMWHLWQNSGAVRKCPTWDIIPRSHFISMRNISKIVSKFAKCGHPCDGWN